MCRELQICTGQNSLWSPNIAYLLMLTASLHYSIPSFLYVSWDWGKLPWAVAFPDDTTVSPCLSLCSHQSVRAPSLLVLFALSPTITEKLLNIRKLLYSNLTVNCNTNENAKHMKVICKWRGINKTNGKVCFHSDMLAKFHIPIVFTYTHFSFFKSSIKDILVITNISNIRKDNLHA